MFNPFSAGIDFYRQKCLSPCRLLGCVLSVNPKHLYNIHTMLVQRRRLWAGVVQMLYNFGPPLGQLLVFVRLYDRKRWREMNPYTDKGETICPHLCVQEGDIIKRHCQDNIGVYHFLLRTKTRDKIATMYNILVIYSSKNKKRHSGKRRNLKIYTSG